MKFGDIFVRQLVGIAMGMSPAPTIVNLYVAIHEKAKIIGKFDSLNYYRRFIDDGFAIWKHHPDPDIDAVNYKSFQDTIRGGGLDWTFTKRAKQVDVMDLTIKIEDDKLSTNLFQKPLALHVFIPPHSCHSKQVLQRSGHRNDPPHPPPVLPSKGHRLLDQTILHTPAGLLQHSMKCRHIRWSITFM